MCKIMLNDTNCPDVSEGPLKPVFLCRVLSVCGSIVILFLLWYCLYLYTSHGNQNCSVWTFNRIWKSSLFTVIRLILSLLLYWVDIVTDFWSGVKYFIGGQCLWGSLTLLFAFNSSFFYLIAIACPWQKLKEWFILDFFVESTNEETEPSTCWYRLIWKYVLQIFIGPLWLACHTFVHTDRTLKSLWRETDDPFLAEESRMNYFYFEATFEAFPQLLLQLIIVCPQFLDNGFGSLTLIQMCQILSSFASLIWVGSKFEIFALKKKFRLKELNFTSEILCLFKIVIKYSYIVGLVTLSMGVICSQSENFKRWFVPMILLIMVGLLGLDLHKSVFAIFRPKKKTVERNNNTRDDEKKGVEDGILKKKTPRFLLGFIVHTLALIALTRHLREFIRDETKRSRIIYALVVDPFDFKCNKTDVGILFWYFILSTLIYKLYRVAFRYYVKTIGPKLGRYTYANYWSTDDRTKTFPPYWPNPRLFAEKGLFFSNRWLDKGSMELKCFSCDESPRLPFMESKEYHIDGGKLTKPTARKRSDFVQLIHFFKHAELCTYSIENDIIERSKAEENLDNDHRVLEWRRIFACPTNDENLQQLELKRILARIGFTHEDDQMNPSPENRKRSVMQILSLNETPYMKDFNGEKLTGHWEAKCVWCDRTLSSESKPLSSQCFCPCRKCISTPRKDVIYQSMKTAHDQNCPWNKYSYYVSNEYPDLIWKLFGAKCLQGERRISRCFGIVSILPVVIAWNLWATLMFAPVDLITGAAVANIFILLGMTMALIFDYLDRLSSKDGWLKPKWEKCRLPLISVLLILAVGVVVGCGSYYIFNVETELDVPPWSLYIIYVLFWLILIFTMFMDNLGFVLRSDYSFPSDYAVQAFKMMIGQNTFITSDLVAKYCNQLNSFNFLSVYTLFFSLFSSVHWFIFAWVMPSIIYPLILICYQCWNPLINWRVRKKIKQLLLKYQKDTGETDQMQPSSEQNQTPLGPDYCWNAHYEILTLNLKDEKNARTTLKPYSRYLTIPPPYASTFLVNETQNEP